VRVIAGAQRGRPLRATTSTRPTADLVKGAIFSMLDALAYKRGFEPDEEGTFAAALAWPRVLDLFAGSGALGIEALSRGAAHCTFIEQDREAARVISTNLLATDLAAQSTLLTGSVSSMLGRVAGPFDLVFADPPYADTFALQEAIDRLTGMLHERSVLVIEQAAAAEPLPAAGDLTLFNTRRHGRTRISLYGQAG
jgi:16S rRNA (guanine966-N2)-methyltransferase